MGEENQTGKKTRGAGKAGGKMIYAKLYWSDLFSDTRSLSNEEMGIYIRLLGEQYLQKSPLPFSQKALQNICGISGHLFRKSVAPILVKFFNYTDKGFVNPRAAHEIDQYIKKYNDIKIIGEERWGKILTPAGVANPNFYAPVLLQISPEKASENGHKSEVRSHKSKEVSSNELTSSEKNRADKFAGQHAGLDGDEWRLLEGRLRKVAPAGEVEAMLDKARSARGPLAYLGAVVRKAEEKHAARSAGGKTLDADGNCTRCFFPVGACDCPPVSARTA